MENIRGNTLVINGQTADVSGYAPDPSADLYYEVIRVIEGKYLFLEDHLERLQYSCKNRISEYPGTPYIISQLKQLIEISEIREGNVRLLLYYHSGQVNVSCFFISHFYPLEEEYSHGVKVRSFGFERPDPNIKLWNEAFRKRVNQFIRDEQIYEAILVNEEGMLTEGSRSNLFFLDKQNRIITAPTKQVLPGITRKYVFQICNDLGLQIIEEAVSLSNISAMHACFISGTSPKVLPIHQLDNTTYNVGHSFIQKIGRAFNELVLASLS